MDYLERYKISDDRLREQFIPTDRQELRVEQFPGFLTNRAAGLAGQASAYLKALGREIEAD